jgi:cobalt-zinc-cadmium efflux system membrane fusion protein
MRNDFRAPRWERQTRHAAAALTAAVLVLGAYAAWRSGSSDAAEAIAPQPEAQIDLRDQSVRLTDTQLQAIRIEAAAERAFPVERDAVGSIDFNEDLTVQVFAPYQGRIIKLFAEIGDEVTKGQTLFTIESPDLIQAESTLIAAAGVLDLTTRALARARQLYKVQGIAQKDVEQAVSDQQSAEGALKAARDAVRVFGKTDAEIDRTVATRKIDPELIVPCPITGRITARNAAPGLFVQPGNPPAPYSVADISTMWMLANVTEADSPLLRVGQPVKVSVLAFPDRAFEGKISRIGAAVDPSTRRLMTRSAILDPSHELRPGMFAAFVIRTGDPVSSVAVPVSGVVREGDGTMTVFVTTDRQRFVKRTVKLGMQRDGYHQIVEGMRPGELIATDGAIFLDNLLSGGGPS